MADAALFARHELPRELAGVVHAAFSRVIGENQSRSLSPLSALSRALVRYGHVAVRVRGALSPAPWPRIPQFAELQSVYWASHRVGMSYDDVAACWEDAEALQGVEPLLRRDLVEAVFPPGLWPAAAAVVTDGPVVAGARLERLLVIESRRVVAPNRRRPDGGPISDRHVGAMAWGLRRLMFALVGLRQGGHPAAALKTWTHVPRSPKIRAVPADTDTSAPPRTTLRLVCGHLDREVRRRLRAADGESEKDALARLPTHRITTKGAFRALRDRAAFLLYVLTGGRRQAVLDVTRRGYEREHRCLDGVVRPAIALRPGKAVTRIRWKILPEEVADRLDVYLAALARCAAEPTAASGPLVVAKRTKPNVGMAPASLWHLFAGQRAKPGNPSGRVGLVPRHPEVLGRDPRDLSDDEHYGYPPDALRHAALQLTRAGAGRYCQEHDLEMDPECMSEVLLDHKVASDRYGYADISTERGREKWAGVAIAVNWRMLRSDWGARRVPDVVAFTAAVRRRETLAAEVTRVREMTDARLARLERNARRSTTTNGSANELLALVKGQVETAALVRHERAVEHELAGIRLEIEQIRHDRGRDVALPDDAPADAARVDLDAVERGITGRGPNQPAGLTPLRDWITSPELAELKEVSPATSRRWTSGNSLPFRAGDPRNPWLDSTPPVDETLGPRRRRIPVNRLAPSVLSSDENRRRLAEMLSEYPEGWSVAECQRPLGL